MDNTRLSQRSVSSAGSGKSQATASSRSLGKYKRVGGNGGVDESLFGPTSTDRSARPSEERVPRSQKSVRKLDKHEKVEMDSVVITQEEMERIRRAARAETLNQAESRRREEQEQRAAAQARAKERKEKMLAREATRKANLQKSDLEIEDEEQATMLNSNAEQAKLEQTDAVKQMNQMTLYAKCVTIRDAQLLEKQMIIKDQQEQEREFERRIEEERSKALRLAEEREEQKKQERLRGAQIIQTQIRQREQERIREMEQLDMEREAMLKKADEIRQLEMEREAERKRAAQEMLAEAAQANKEQLERKRQMKQAQEEEERRIAAYIAERDRKEQERQEELEAENRRKAEEVARLRAMQEKQNDRAAEMDALRAKRAAEDYERSWRERERTEALRKQQQLEEIQRSREEMQRQKEAVLSQAAQMEKEQFQKILHVQKAAEAQLLDKERQRREENMAHNAALRMQIAENMELKARQRQEFLDEGAKARYEIEKERMRIEKIKQNKIKDLKSLGVPEKYLTQLQNVKVNVS